MIDDLGDLAFLSQNLFSANPLAASIQNSRLLHTILSNSFKRKNSTNLFALFCTYFTNELKKYIQLKFKNLSESKKRSVLFLYLSYFKTINCSSLFLILASSFLLTELKKDGIYESACILNFIF